MKIDELIYSDSDKKRYRQWCRKRKRYQRSRNRIEIDIIYDCDLKCFNCDRFCRQAPSKEYMTINQIEYFIEESRSNEVKWDKISILGGEPTLHPQVVQIVNLLCNAFPKTTFHFVTNGFNTNRVNEVLPQIPKIVTIINTKKKFINNVFYPVTSAPRDYPEYKDTDFTKGCYLCMSCGMSLNCYGYYPCAVSAAIDRVLGFDMGRKTFPSQCDLMLDELKLFCSYCGLFKDKHRTVQDDDVMSATWRRVIEKYNIKRPVLTRYRQQTKRN